MRRLKQPVTGPAGCVFSMSQLTINVEEQLPLTTACQRLRAAYELTGCRLSLNAVGVVSYQDLNALEKLLWSANPTR